MLALLVSWLTISFLFISFGDMFVCLYNKTCKKDERYNLLDTLLLGLCFILIPVQLASLWIPVNHYLLFTLIGFSGSYWSVQRTRLVMIYESIKHECQNLTFHQWLLLTTSILSVIIFMLWSSSFHDAAFYHYQNIHWNEDYAIVPGLGNLEDRFAFNSNYILLSALFSFRFLFGKAIYGFHAIIFIYILVWVLIGIFKQNYNTKNVFLLIVYIILFILVSSTFADSNTDIIPNLLIFYILARISLDNDYYKKHSLAAFILPVSLITFKLSTGTFCLISLFILYTLVRTKQTKTISFLVIASISICGLWLIRNVIISGYLVYPVYSIDIFQVDWKMPLGTAKLQKFYITEWGNHTTHYIFDIINGKIQFDKVVLISTFFSYIILFFNIISPIILALVYWKNKYKFSLIFVYYITSLIHIIFWFISAPDFRFISGCLLGISFLITSLLFASPKNAFKVKPRLGIIVTGLIVLFLLGFTTKNFRNKSVEYNTLSSYHNNIAPSLRENPNLLITPYSSTWLNTLNSKYYALNFEKYSAKNIDIYISVQNWKETFDLLPCTSMDGIPFEPFLGGKIQSVRTIEPRGNTLQEGFRTKPEYVKEINERVDEFKVKYFDRYKNEKQ